MQIDLPDRLFIEHTKTARSIKLIINEGYDDMLVLDLPRRRSEGMKKLSHDIALAIQDYVIRTTDK